MKLKASKWYTPTLYAHYIKIEQCLSQVYTKHSEDILSQHSVGGI